jgi:zinc transport system permease protein
MNLVGSLLISALVIFPALSAMRVARTFKGVVITAAIISTLCALIGILTAILASTPVGPTVVAVDILAFALCFLAGKLGKAR